MRKLIVMLLGTMLVFSCKSPEARKPITQKSGSYINESIERNKKIVAAEEEQIKEIIEKDSTHQYISSPNGFWYYYHTKDTTGAATPKFGDIVEFDYNLRTLDGQSIYSKEELSTRTYAMDQEKLFSGLREGLKIMKEGETITFLFPSHKAYGYYGDKKRIGTNVAVISTVTLNKISQENNNQNNE